MTPPRPPNRPTRRTVLRSLSAGTLAALAGCGANAPSEADSESGSEPPSATTGASTADLRPDETVELPANTGTNTVAGDTSWDTWRYDGQIPGPELRVREGDVFRARVSNQLPESTTIHWHGVPVRNAMDGVPEVTQQPISTGETFEYSFRAEPAGTYFYHSHVGLQLDRGLAGPLIIEEADPHVEYDRDITLVLDDFLPGPPQMPDASGGGGSGGMGSGSGGMGGGMMGDTRPPYEGLLINGRLPSDPPSFSVEDGERIRMRFINASSATTFHVALAGHEMQVSHADGRPVEPVGVDSFVFGAGERYDAIVEANSPGAWEVRAAALDGDEPPAKAVLRYGNSDDAPTPVESTGQQLRYSDLRALSPVDGIDSGPDRTFDLTLSAGGGRSYRWTIDGQTYPDADPLRISAGDHVRVRMTNHSPVVHPMHLHGHFFQVGDAVKDTVLVPGHMGEVTFDFIADNPGQWLFHCHNLYHLHAGMARAFVYE
ncbi:multicopper oxidase family protein [Halomarina litorea]|uniref:multicopper oxidase family protein n=1 Tax=Halomarina litorea TaxID=2961595 RepID=UPI0020C418FF|nr:multicopper oxidase family protein [Halomarina sp. BCD28]